MYCGFSENSWLRENEKYMFFCVLGANTVANLVSKYSVVGSDADQMRIRFVTKISTQSVVSDQMRIRLNFVIMTQNGPKLFGRIRCGSDTDQMRIRYGSDADQIEYYFLTQNGLLSDN